MKTILIVWLIFFTFTSSAAERRHKLKVTGGHVDQLTVETLEKDFPKLASYKTSLQKEEIQLFEGVLFSDLMKKYAPPGTTKVKVSATNNYSQTLTEKDIHDWKALLAFKSNGKVIPTKTRGTFRVVYDYNKYKEDPAVEVVLDTNSVWQAISIEFLK